MSLRKAFKKFYNEYTEWFREKSPTDLAISGLKLAEEAGEVAEAVIAFAGASKNKIRKLLRKGQTPRDAVKEELGDVIVVCLNIATLCNIEHDDLFESAAIKAKRRTEEIRQGVR